MNENVFYRDYYGQTTLAPLGAIAIIVLGLALLLVPRKYAAYPMLAMACFVPPAQRIVVLSLNFDLLRIMVLFGSVRVILRGEWSGFRWNRLDWLLVIWCCYALFASSVNYMSLDAVKYQSGAVYDALGMYFLFRFVVRDWSDVDEICRAMALLSMPVLGFFLIERTTGHNMFAALGGVPAITDVREGRLRCQGAFAHSILAGCFWAWAMPLLVAQWWRKGIPQWLSVIGILFSGGIVFLCSSSTPVSSVIIGSVALTIFCFRRHLLWILTGLSLVLISLQFAMHHPIWWLLSYVDIVGGSTGWYRYNVMQQAADHLSEWWLIGSAQGTAHWGFVDVTNYYVVEGLQGGLGLMTLFMGMLAMGFACVARAVKLAGKDRTRALLAWALGTGLLMHATNYLAIAYFGQIEVLWYMQLAVVSSLSTRSTALRGSSRISSRKYHPRLGHEPLPLLPLPNGTGQ